ncbi:MAG: type II toxin-antitoxin system prevent-host-death family antitoxin [Robiginitomaculum sp.]|nr:MAG: type II toxin-antitoxin system prevent-host-death family antitoxin [Robiginitomaculum sp.]
MKTLSSTELRKNLSKLMDQVNDDHEPVIITRAGGKLAVLLSLEDYDALDETAYLLASSANRKALLASIAQIEAGNVVEAELIEAEFTER